MTINSSDESNDYHECQIEITLKPLKFDPLTDDLH